MDKLRKLFAKEVHTQRQKIFVRRKVVVTHMDEIWAMDLASMENISKDNKDFKFILCVIDVFSKFAWCIPLKNKSAPTVLDSVKKIVAESGRQPNKIWCDQGTEFYNKLFATWNKSKNITMYSTFGDSKSVVAERFIRTIRTAIEKIFTESQTKNWIKILPELVKTYNNTKHSTIKMTPVEASKPENEVVVYNNLTKLPKTKVVKQKFVVGDKVRISKIKKTFDKGYVANWSSEIFIITKVLQTTPITYKIKDKTGEDIIGSFYTQELLKTAIPDDFK